MLLSRQAHMRKCHSQDHLPVFRYLDPFPISSVTPLSHFTTWWSISSSAPATWLYWSPPYSSPAWSSMQTWEIGSSPQNAAAFDCMCISRLFWSCLQGFLWASVWACCRGRVCGLRRCWELGWLDLVMSNFDWSSSLLQEFYQLHQFCLYAQSQPSQPNWASLTWSSHLCSIACTPTPISYGFCCCGRSSYYSPFEHDSIHAEYNGRFVPGSRLALDLRSALWSRQFSNFDSVMCRFRASYSNFLCRFRNSWSRCGTELLRFRFRSSWIQKSHGLL